MLVDQLLVALIPFLIFASVSLMKEKLTLEDFGYHFNKDGELRDLNTNERFVFDVFNDSEKNQQHYERLGKVVEEYVYRLLEEEAKLLRVTIPIDHTMNESVSFIFQSGNALDCDKLLLLIHGSGVVKAGQWSRRLIINHRLESGSQLPYINKAQELGFGVLVLNSNENYDENTKTKIRDNETPVQHFDYIWENFVDKSKAKYVAIVAHSYGGVVAMSGIGNNINRIKRTFAVALTDSVHAPLEGRHTKHWIGTNVCNWVSSSKPLDVPLENLEGDCQRVSAGTKVHEETSWKAFDSVWQFISTRWNDTIHANDGVMPYNNQSVENIEL